jgi:hypothetical protein
MAMRRGAKGVNEPDSGPLVCDAHGRPVGVHVDTATAVDDTANARRIMRLDALRKTGELEAQYRLRCQVSLFCSDPPR